MYNIFYFYAVRIINVKKKQKNYENIADNELAKQFANEAIESLYIYGHISKDEFSSPEKTRKLLKKMITSLKKEDFHMIVDHKESLLEIADQFKKNDNINFAKVFYAMFFEHAINSVIDIITCREKWTENLKLKLLKKNSLEEKLTWVLELLHLPQFNEKYLNIVKNLVADRNAFVHYKYKPDLDIHLTVDQLNKKEEKTQKELNGILKAVNYMKKYESRITYYEK
ncbi:hypothetical protein KAW80_02825 [Candidatus Babeliales bacterium]|nr:hypothetical protein [Candidatus Babeliales bacterium]